MVTFVYQIIFCFAGGLLIKKGPWLAYKRRGPLVFLLAYESLPNFT